MVIRNSKELFSSFRERFFENASKPKFYKKRNMKSEIIEDENKIANTNIITGSSVNPDKPVTGSSVNPDGSVTGSSVNQNSISNGSIDKK